MSELVSLAAEGEYLAARLEKTFPCEREVRLLRQLTALAGETGEFIGAAERWLGVARRTGTLHAAGLELADVVLTAYVSAHFYGIDLDQAITEKLVIIKSRGWKDAR